MRIVRTLALILLALPMACGKVDTDSHVAGALNQQTPVCHSYPQATMTALDAELKGVNLFIGFTDAERPELLKHFYALPKIYRDQVVDVSKSGEFKGFIKENIDSSGVCYGGSRFCTKISLNATQKGVISFSFIHEAGHGLMSTVAKNAGITRNQLITKYEEFMLEGKAHNQTAAGKTAPLKIRDYSFSGVNEYWADSFHNYYCSPASNEFIKKYLPKNYEFLQKNLPVPSWIDGGTTDTSSPAKKHVEDLVSLYNTASKTCDFSLDTVSTVASNGDFKAKLLLKGSSKSLEISSNAEGSLSSELFKMRRGMPALLADCPAE